MTLIETYLHRASASGSHAPSLFFSDTNEQIQTSALIERFVSSSMVYYPGAGFDGQAVAVFNKGRIANAFLYADNGIDPKAVKDRLHRTAGQPSFGFSGYDIAAFRSFTAHDLPLKAGKLGDQAALLGYFVVYSREDNFDDEHGFRQFALMYVFVEACQALSLVVGQNAQQIHLEGILLQNHEWAGCRFGHGSDLEKLAWKTGCRPRYALVGPNTLPWSGYEQVPQVMPSICGVHHQERRLWQYTGSNYW